MSSPMLSGWFRRRFTHPARSLYRRRLEVTQLEAREVPAFLGGVNVAYGDVNGDGYADVVCGMASQGCQVVVVNGKDGTKLAAFDAYEPTFTGGVYVAVGDVDGDGDGEIITGTGNGGGPNVRIYDGLGNPIASYFPYEDSFRGGVIVGAGDANGDGMAEVYTGTGVTGGPRVQILDALTGTPLANFFAYESSFRGGVIVATGDYNGDGKDELYTGTGKGGGPRVQVFDATTQATLANFFAYESDFRGGVIVGAGDANGDRKDDVFCGTGVGGAPRTQVFDAASQAPLANFFAYADTFRGGVNVTGGDVTGDGDAEILTGPGPGELPTVNIFSPDGSKTLFSFSPFDPASFPGTPISTLPTPNQLSLELGTATLDATPNVGAYLPIQVRIVNPTANSKVTFSYTISPNTGLTVQSDEPAGGWTMSTKQTFTVNQIYKGSALGKYTIHMIAALAGTNITVAQDLTVNVVTTKTGTPVLTPPNTNPSSQAPNTTTQVRFSTVLSGTKTPPTTVTLQNVDNTGTVLVTLRNLVDDGTGTDLFAGDRIYSGTFDVASGTQDSSHLFRTLATISGTTVTSVPAAILATAAPTTFAPTDPGTAVTDPSSGAKMIPNQILVQFQPGTKLSQMVSVAATVGGTLIGAIPGMECYQFSIPGPVTAATPILAAVQWMTHAEVLSAYPSMVGTNHDVPADGGQGGQYGYYKIRANEALVAASGAGIVVAVIDSGVDYTQIDLDGQVIKGYDFGNNDNDPKDGDFTGHGTHVAGIIAANANGFGTSGVSAARILAVKDAPDGSFGFSDPSMISAIRYAVDNGAKILNISQGEPGYGIPLLPDSNPFLKRAINYAISSGRLVVASAGNTGTDAYNYPASYDNVLSVGNTDQNDVRDKDSNYGGWVKITAPGVNIQSTLPNNTFATQSGTSMSAPHVAGVAALVWSAFPELTNTEVMDRLIKTAAPLTGTTKTSFPNAGRVDAFEAVMNGSFENGLSNWTTSGSTAVYNRFGRHLPTDRTSIAYLSTGPSGDQVAASFERTFTAGPRTHDVTIRVSFVFITEEYHEFVGTKFNDTLQIELVGSGGGSIATASVNATSFIKTQEFNFPGGDNTAGETNWTEASKTFTITPGQSYTLRIRIADAGDDIYDSVALIDRIRFA